MQRDREYIAKRTQYQERGIPEYWIINPETETVSILQLSKAGSSDGSNYRDVGSFSGDDRLQSPLFATLDLAAKQLFEAGRAET